MAQAFPVLRVIRKRDQASFPASGNLGPGWLFRLRGARQSPE